MRWSDKTFCEHGATLSEPCDYCEIAGLKETLKWMSRRVKRDEVRLQELIDKNNPLTLSDKID